MAGRDDMRKSTKELALRVFPKARELRNRLRTTEARSRALQRRVEQLEERVRMLDEDIREARRLNKRIAELTDLVGEVLLPVASRDDAHVHDRLRAFVEKR